MWGVVAGVSPAPTHHVSRTRLGVEALTKCNSALTCTNEALTNGPYPDPDFGGVGAGETDLFFDHTGIDCYISDIKIPRYNK